MASIRKGTVKASGAPVGKHFATFVDAEEVEPSEQAIAEGWGPSMKLIWEIEGTGEIATRICPQTPTLKNATGKLIGGLLDRVLGVNEEWDLGPCVGQRYKITVEMSEKGTGTRVTDCTKV